MVEAAKELKKKNKKVRMYQIEFDDFDDLANNMLSPTVSDIIAKVVPM